MKTRIKTDVRPRKALGVQHELQRVLFSDGKKKAQKLEGNCPKSHQWQSLGPNSSPPSTQDQPSPYSKDMGSPLTQLEPLSYQIDLTVSTWSQ